MGLMAWRIDQWEAISEMLTPRIRFVGGGKKEQLVCYSITRLLQFSVIHFQYDSERCLMILLKRYLPPQVSVTVRREMDIIFLVPLTSVRTIGPTIEWSHCTCSTNFRKRDLECSTTRRIFFPDFLVLSWKWIYWPAEDHENAIEQVTSPCCGWYFQRFRQQSRDRRVPI